MFQNWRAHVHSTSPMEKCSRQQGPAVSRRIFSRGQTKSLTYYCFCAPLTCCVTSRRGAIKIRNDVTNSAGCSNCFRLCDDAVDPPSHVSRYARSLRPDRKGLMKTKKIHEKFPPQDGEKTSLEEDFTAGCPTGRKFSRRGGSEKQLLGRCA